MEFPALLSPPIFNVLSAVYSLLQGQYSLLMPKLVFSLNAYKMLISKCKANEHIVASHSRMEVQIGDRGALISSVSCCSLRIPVQYCMRTKHVHCSNIMPTQSTSPSILKHPWYTQISIRGTSQLCWCAEPPPLSTFGCLSAAGSYNNV